MLVKIRVLVDRSLDHPDDLLLLYDFRIQESFVVRLVRVQFLSDFFRRQFVPRLHRALVGSFSVVIVRSLAVDLGLFREKVQV